MKMTMDQTKLVYYTMELDLKTREYQNLCAELEEIKKKGIDPNDESLIVLKEKFEKNFQEIKNIKDELKKLQKIDK